MNHILFYDAACPSPYSSASIHTPGSTIGGAESTLIRIAERLSEKHRVSVGQHNRTKHEQEPGDRLQWLTKKEAMDPSLAVDSVVVQRRVGDLPLVKRQHPHARSFVWSHDWFKPPPGTLSRAGFLWRIKVETRFFLYAYYRAVEIGVSRTHMENIKDSLLQTRAIGRLRDRVRLEYIYNPIDDDLRPSTESSAYDPTKLIFFSAPWKGLDMVLETFQAVHKRMTDLKLYIASPGYHQMGPSGQSASENVVYLGNLTHDAVLREVRNSLCVFYPANLVPETFGLVFAESNAVGTPVLAHPFGAAPEVLTPEQLVDARDINGIVDRLRKWREGRRPIVTAKEQFRLRNVAQEWERVLFS
jgi:glycosyltransferase involved in cell wall biosynthesis